MERKNTNYLRFFTLLTVMAFITLPDYAVRFFYRNPPRYDPPMGATFDDVNLIMSIFAVWIGMVILSLVSGSLVKILVESEKENKIGYSVASMMIFSYLAYHIPSIIDKSRDMTTSEGYSLSGFYISWALMLGYIFKVPWDHARDYICETVRSKLSSE